MPDCVWYATDIAFPVYGGVLRHRFEADRVEERVADLLAETTAAGKTPMWWVTPTSEPACLGACLAAKGAERAVQLQGMAAPITALDLPDAPAEVTIEPADTEERVEQYAGLYPMLFGAPMEGWIEDVVKAEIALFQSGDDPFRRWVALLDGKPVSAGATSRSGNAVTLQTLCTLPEHRNRGFGAALMREAFDAEANRGAETVCLWAGPGADRLYGRVGFQYVGPADIYVFPPAE